MVRANLRYSLAMKSFTVAGAIIAHADAQTPPDSALGSAGDTDGDTRLDLTGDHYLLVCNQRRNGSTDWTPPGGIVDAGETVLQGLAREVEEETKVRVTEWGEQLYRVSVDFAHMDWKLNVEVFRAVAWEGALHVDDPDGVVIDAEFVAGTDLADRVSLSPRWVSEPLLTWFQGTSPIADPLRFRANKGDDNELEVIRLS